MKKLSIFTIIASLVFLFLAALFFELDEIGAGPVVTTPPGASTVAEQGPYSAETLTDGGVLIGNADESIQATSVMENGELLIGDGAGSPSVSTLTAGSGVTITNAAGSITIAATTSTNYTVETATVGDGEYYTPASGYGHVYAQLTFSAEGAVYTLGESSPTDGSTLVISNVGSYSAIMYDSSGIQEMSAQLQIDPHNTAVFTYSSDRWIYTGGDQDSRFYSSLQLPNGTDPVVDAVGEIAYDTDAANEASDSSLRIFDSALSKEVMMARAIKCYQWTVIAPNDLDDTERDQFPIWHNNTGMTFTITEAMSWSDTDDTDFAYEVVTATNWTAATLEAITIDDNGTGVFYKTTAGASFDDGTVVHDEIVVIDFDDTDEPGMVKGTLCGWFNDTVD